MKDLAVEDNEDGEGNPVIAHDQRRVEDWVLEELNHAFTGKEVAFAHEMFPAENTDKEEDRRYHPSHRYHCHHLKLVHFLAARL